MAETTLPVTVSTIELSLGTTVSLGGQDAEGVTRWTGTATAGDGQRVGELQALVIDLVRCPDPWGALDSSNDTIAHIGETVFDMNTGQLSEAIESRLRGRGDRVVLLDRIELEPQWQGRGIGALVAAELLDRLRPGVRAALCLPGPLDRSGMSQEEYDQGVQRMQRLWAKAGFRPLAEGVWLLDLGTGALDESLAALRARHGLGR